jgi:hypothetical protein
MGERLKRPDLDQASFPSRLGGRRVQPFQETQSSRGRRRVASGLVTSGCGTVFGQQ